MLNGIVENYRELKESLLAEGHTFSSETDAEVVVHLIERAYTGDLAAAVQAAFAQLEGHFSFVAIHHDHPLELVGVRCQTPLVVGVGEGEMFLASSIAAFLSETRRVQFLEDAQVVTIRPEGATFFDSEPPPVTEIDWDEESAVKGGYETFMLKEIYEQPEAVRETIGDRVRGHKLLLESLGMEEEQIRNLRRVVIVACGTAYHAGVVGRYVLEEWARIPVEPDIASEWIYRNPVLSRDTLVIGISQSGETRDTVNAMKLARAAGARTLAITNLMGTQITREADSVLYTRCGLEVGVAASKTFTAQVALLYLLGLKLAEIRRTLPQPQIEFILDRLHELPDKIAEFLNGDHPIDEIARRFYDQPFFLYLGRHIGLPVALEGALKLKEISYVPDRCLLGRRDEARPDRAPRGGDAGRRRRDRPEGDLRQGDLEHPGDPRAGRARDRDRNGRQRGHPAPRRRRDLRAANAGLPPGSARGRAAAAACVQDCQAPRPERRSAAEPGEDGYRRVAGRYFFFVTGFFLTTGFLATGFLATGFLAAAGSGTRTSTDRFT